MDEQAIGWVSLLWCYIATGGRLKLRGKTLIRELVHLDVQTTKTLLDEVLYGDVLITV